MRGKLARIWFILFAVVIFISTLATYYRYIVRKDFILFESEPEIELNITEDAL